MLNVLTIPMLRLLSSKEQGHKDFRKLSKPCHESWFSLDYCKTHYYRAPLNFTHFALGDDNTYITGADIRSK